MLQKERKYKNLLKLWLKLEFITFLKRKSKQMTQQEKEKKIFSALRSTHHGHKKARQII